MSASVCSAGIPVDRFGWLGGARTHKGGDWDGGSGVVIVRANSDRGRAGRSRIDGLESGDLVIRRSWREGLGSGPDEK